jgi:PPK2 family polyphosphate:nucleotide phosphotransferase
MIKLSDYSTLPPKGLDKKTAKEESEKLTERLGELQEMLMAQKKYALLVVFQGMDGSGKDGAVDHVFKGCHFGGLQIVSYKKPTEEEFAHDFLWRIHKNAPAKGMIGIFNRSHYEDVIIQRVHKWIDEERVAQRIATINAFESLLSYDNNTQIVKFYFHISKEEQEIELNERLNEPTKQWKHNPNDWKEREFWNDYMRCYEDVINKSEIPWHIVPVDDRWYRDYFILKTLVETLEKMDLAYPKITQ